jgi:hypothetical protein
MSSWYLFLEPQQPTYHSNICHVQLRWEMELGKSTLNIKHDSLIEHKEEEIIAHKCTSHPSNITNLTPYRFVANPSQVAWIGLIQGIWSWSSAKSTKIETYEFYTISRFFLLDEWRVSSSHLINPSPPWALHQFWYLMACTL